MSASIQRSVYQSPTESFLKRKEFFDDSEAFSTSPVSTPICAKGACTVSIGSPKRLQQSFSQQMMDVVQTNPSQKQPSLPQSPIVVSQKPYRVYRSPLSKRVRILLTPNIQRMLSKIHRTQKGVIYRFTGDDQGREKSYTGASQVPAARMRNHLFKVNNGDAPQTRLSSAIRKNPESFRVQFLEVVHDPKVLDEREKEHIAQGGGKGNTFNVNEGGGGPRARPTSSGLTVQQAVSAVAKGYVSPVHKKFLSLQQGRYEENLSADEARQTEVVYDFFVEENPADKKQRVHHIGYTTQTVGDRIRQHLSALNDPKSAAYRSNPALYDWLWENMKKIQFRVFFTEDLKKKRLTMPELEKAFGHFFKRRGEMVRNIKALGRGGVSKK